MTQTINFYSVFLNFLICYPPTVCPFPAPPVSSPPFAHTTTTTTTTIIILRSNPVSPAGAWEETAWPEGADWTAFRKMKHNIILEAAWPAHRGWTASEHLPTWQLRGGCMRRSNFRLPLNFLLIFFKLIGSLWLPLHIPAQSAGASLAASQDGNSGRGSRSKLYSLPRS